MAKKTIKSPRHYRPYASRRDRVEQQAFELLQERLRLFGDQWLAGCAIKVPPDMLATLEYHGIDEFLRMEMVPTGNSASCQR